MDGSVARLEDGVKSLGMRMLQSLGSIMLRGGGWTWETKGDASVITTPEYMTFSAWIKYEPGTDPEGPSMPFVFVNHQAAALRVGRAVYSSSAGMRDGGDGLTLVQQGASGQTVGLTCDFSGMPSITGRWTHVCAVLPRVSGARDDFELWVDGVKRELSAVSGYASFPRPGRDINKKWQVGGYTNNTTAGSASYDQQLLKSNQGLFAFATNTVSGGFRSPVFPGVIDEVRFYSSRLSAAQIRALAMEPDANRNFAPFIDAPPAVPLTVRRNAALGLSLGVYDDGMPLGGALSCSWEVVSGNAAAVAFGDRSSASTTAAFFAVGEYALRLVADDGERKSFSAPVHVRVLPSGLIFMVR